SPSTIAKALRERDDYFREYADKIEVPARIVADAFQCDVRLVLEDEGLFMSARDTAPRIAPGEELGDRLGQFKDAYGDIENEWYALEEEFRVNVLEYLERNDDGDEDP